LIEHELRHCERIRLTTAGRASRRREILEQSLRPDLELDPIVDVVGYDLAPGLPAAVQMPYRLRGPTGSRLSLADWASDPSTDRILIRGAVGAGKSSLLRAYHRDRCREALADPARPIPLETGAATDPASITARQFPLGSLARERASPASAPPSMTSRGSRCGRSRRWVGSARSRRVTDVSLSASMHGPTSWSSAMWSFATAPTRPWSETSPIPPSSTPERLRQVARSTTPRSRRRWPSPPPHRLPRRCPSSSRQPTGRARPVPTPPRASLARAEVLERRIQTVPFVGAISDVFTCWFELLPAGHSEACRAADPN
jgi:hypothetical protein